jgi:hypothetical protein
MPNRPNSKNEYLAALMDDGLFIDQVKSPPPIPSWPCLHAEMVELYHIQSNIFFPAQIRPPTCPEERNSEQPPTFFFPFGLIKLYSAHTSWSVSKYCSISIDSNKIRLFSNFEKSQKIGKIENKLNPGSEKMCVTRDVRINRNSTVCSTFIPGIIRKIVPRIYFKYVPNQITLFFPGKTWTN